MPKSPNPRTGEKISRGEFIRGSARWLAGGVLAAAGLVLGFRKSEDGSTDCPPGGICSQCGRRGQCERKTEAGGGRLDPASSETPTKDPKGTKDK